MKRLFLLLALVALACSAPAHLPTVAATPQPTVVKPAPKQPTVQAAPVTVQVTADSLHVRAEPMGLRIGYLYNADAVTLTNKCSDGWAQIKWQGATAWVRAKYLSDNKCQTGEK
jgi:uncharacterized protein YgiM (DUF1202 family)